MISRRLADPLACGTFRNEAGANRDRLHRSGTQVPSLARPWNMKKLLPYVIAAAAVASLAACGSPASPSAAASASSPPAVQAAGPSPDCATQVSTWASAGGTTSLTAVGTDSGTLGTGLTSLVADLQAGTGASADASAVQTAAATMQADSQALEASPGPSCVPGMAADISAAAKSYNTAAIDATNSVNQLSAGNTEAATGDIQAATAAEGKGNGKIGAANTAVKNFSGS